MRLSVFAPAIALAGLGIAALAGGAFAQDRPYSLTFYDQPAYRGGSVTFDGDNANVGTTGFSSRAQSACRCRTSDAA